MAPNPNLHSSNGLPVCLSGITSPLTFSTEIADHDRRRKVFKKKIFGVQLEMRSNQRSHYQMRIVEDTGDLTAAATATGDLTAAATAAGDMSCLTITSTTCCIAKAA